MKTLYIECQMGAAGDMLTAALLELVEDKAEFVNRLNRLGIPKVTYRLEPDMKCGITGSRMIVTIDGEIEGENNHAHDHHHDHNHHTHDHYHDHEHHAHEYHHEHEHHHEHHGLHEIGTILNELNCSEKVKWNVWDVYQLIAEAESKAHNKPVNEIHFHEVGNLDAIADITAVAMLFEELSPERVVVSPIHVGCGHVHCAHGILPVPAPATAHILRGVPIYGGKIQGELCTPTGAALLKHFATEFGEMPVMNVDAIGYGMGKKEFSAANCVRVMIGQTEDQSSFVYELQCNLDDMTAEEIGFTMDRLFEVGALDAYTTAIGMKKNRPGTMLGVICKEDAKEKIVQALFKYTTTLGIRVNKMHRYSLERNIEKIQTIHGVVRVKHASGYGVERSKYEYDDLSRIARAEGRTIREVISLLDNSGK